MGLLSFLFAVAFGYADRAAHVAVQPVVQSPSGRRAQSPGLWERVGGWLRRVLGGALRHVGVPRHIGGQELREVVFASSAHVFSSVQLSSSMATVALRSNKALLKRGATPLDSTSCTKRSSGATKWACKRVCCVAWLFVLCCAVLLGGRSPPVLIGHQ